MERIRAFIILIWFILSVNVNAQEAPRSLTLDGRLYDSTSLTDPLLNNSVLLRIQILDNSKACVLYEETQTVDTSASNGYFNIKVGSALADAKRTGADPGNAMDDIFQNRSLIAANNAGCVAGYTPAAGHERFLRMFVTPNGFPQDQLADMTINAVPTAMVAETVQGLDRSKILELGTVPDLTQANVEGVFSATNYPRMTSLLGGTSTQYIRSTVNGAPIPQVAGNPGTLTVGYVWYDSVANQLKYYDGAVRTITQGGTGSFVVNGGQTGAVIAGTNDANTLSLKTNNVARMTLDTNGRIGVGTATPSEMIDVQSTTGSAKIAVTSDLIGGNAPGFVSTLYKSTGGAGTGYPVWSSRLSRGSQASPLPLITGEVLMSQEASGTYDNSGTFVNGAMIQAVANGNWAAGSYPTNLTFSTTSSGAFTPGETMRLESTGRVGIGTNAPVTQLHVANNQNATTEVRVQNSNAGATAAARFSAQANGVSTSLTSYGTAAGNAAQLHTSAPTLSLESLNAAGTIRMYTGSPLTEKVTVLTNGNVGIGNASPTAQLHLVSAATNPMIVQNTVNTAKSQILFQDSAGTSKASIGWNNSAVGTNPSAMELGSLSTQPLIITTNSTERIRVTADGYVGMGTSTPATGTRLDIAGTTAADSSIIVPRADTANRPVTGVNGMMRYNTSLNKFEFYENGAWASYTTGSGDFMKDGSVAMTGAFRAIDGTTAAPSITFANENTTGFRRSAADQVSFVTGGTDKITFWNSAVYANSFNNLASANNARVSTAATGTTIDRNVADANPALIVQQINAGSTGDILQVKNNASTVLTVKQGGNVGIGTATPSGVLDVQGATNSASAISLTAGSINTATTAGAVNITGGANSYGISNASAQGGNVNITAGASPLGTGGSVVIRGGTGNINGSGPVTISGANNTNNGGPVTITGGVSSALSGGGLTLTGGTGNTTGGTVTITGGTSGNTTGANVAITGGTSTANGGGGNVAISGGTASSGNGGSVTLTARAGVGTNRNGGNLILTAGAATGSGTAGSIQLLSGNVGIGTASPNQLLTVEGPMSLRTQAAPTATANYGKIYVDSGDSDKLKYMNPAGAITDLSASGGTPAADSLDFTEFKDAMALDASTDIAASGTNVLSITNSGTGDSFRVNDQAADATPFVIDASGNVGIGAPTPGFSLDVAGAGRFSTSVLVAGASSANGYDIALSGDSTKYIGVVPNLVSNIAPGADLVVTAGTRKSGGTDLAGGTLFLRGGVGAGTGGSNVEIQTATGGASGAGANNPTTKMIVTGAGNVGIGTSTPTTGARLDVSGATAADSSIIIPRADTANRPAVGVNGMMRYNTSLARFEVYENGAWTNMVANGTPAANSLDFTEFKDAMALDASTDIAVDNAEVLSITNTGTGNSFLVNDQAGDTSPFVITAAGDVGIGTSTPAYKFQVENVSTTTAGGWNPASVFEATASPTANSTSQYIGLQGGADNNNNFDVAQLIGILGLSGKNGSGTVVDLFGIQGYPFMNAGTATRMASLVAQSSQTGGAITDSIGVLVLPNAISGGTTTNSVGVEIQPRNGTNTWGLYQTGASDKNYFAGQVGIGTTSPNQLLTVEGPMSLRTQAAPTATANYGKLYVDSGDSNKLKYMNPAGAIADLSAAAASGPNLVVAPSTNSLIGGTTGASAVATANNNTAFGYQAMNDLTTGASNVAIGSGAMEAVLAGNSSVAVGYFALGRNTNGGSNVAIGMGTLSNSITGSNNVGMGRQTLENSTGDSNTAIGKESGQALTTGSNNLMLGYRVGATGLTTGSNNILIGTNDTVTTPATGTNNFLNIGNTIYGNLANGNVGIGTSSPTGTLHVDGGTAAASTAGSNITFKAQDAGAGAGNAGGSIALSTGAGAGGWGYGDVTMNLGAGNSGRLLVSKSFTDTYAPTSAAVNAPPQSMSIDNSWSSDGNTSLIALGAPNTSARYQRTYLGTVSVTGAANYSPALVFGHSTGNTAYAERMRISENGYLGIGTTDPNQLLTVEGPMSLRTQAAPTATANYGKIYVDSGDSNKLKYMNPAGTITDLSSAGGTPAADSLDFTELKDTMALDASTDIAVDNAEVLSITNTGTGESFRVNDQATDTTPFVIDAAGRVGIGTATPGSSLHVVGNERLEGNLFVGATATTSFKSIHVSPLPAPPTDAIGIATNGNLSMITGAGLSFGRANVAGSNINYGSIIGEMTDTTTSGEKGVLKFLTKGSAGGSAERMRIDDLGNVGIGTSTPTAGTRLDITGTTTADSSIIIPRADTASRPTTGVNGMVRYNTSLAKFEAYENGGWTNMIGGGSADNLGNHTATQVLNMAGFNIVNGGTDGIFVATDGTVDVGASNGSNSGYHTLFRAYRNAINNRGIGIGYYADGSSDTAGFIRTTGNGTDMVFAPTDAGGIPTERMRITNTGAVGIGTASPSAPLDILDNTSNGIKLTRTSGTAGSYGIWVNSSGRMGIGDFTSGAGIRITPAGEVGIGSSDPTGFKLRVRQTATDTDAAYHTSNSTFYDLAPAANSASNFQAIYSSAESSTAFNFTGSMTGVRGDAFHNGSGTMTDARGVRGVAGPGSTGTMTSAIGVSGDILSIGSSTSTITDAMGLYGHIYNTNANTTMTNAYGAKLEFETNSGTITNGYGLYVGQILGTNKWGVYQNDSTAKNYFAGGVGVGASPTAGTMLDVAGTTTANSSILIPRATTATRPTGVNGMMRYNTTLNKFEAYENGAWTNMISDGSGSGGYSADLTTGKTVTGTFTFVGSGATGNAALIDNTSTPAADPAGANASQYFQIDFGAGNSYDVRRLMVKTSSTGGYANAITYNFRWSDDNSSWTTVGSFTVPASSGTILTFDFPSSGAHRYWKAQYASGTVSGNTWIEEIEMMEYSGGASQIWSASGSDTYFNGGNVGIGTASPEANLHLYGTGTSTTLGQLNTNLRLASDTTTANAGSEISFRGHSTAAANVATYAAISAPLGANDGTGAGGYLAFSTKATQAATSLTERMRIGADGSVAIGNTSASARLDVQGAGATSATFGLGVKNSSGTYALAVRDDGNVGIGTTTPSQKLSVNGKAHAWNYYSGYGTANDPAFSPSGGVGMYAENSGADLTFSTASTERIRVLANGRVGVGTSSPNFLMHLSSSSTIDEGFGVTAGAGTLSMRTNGTTGQAMIESGAGMTLRTVGTGTFNVWTQSTSAALHILPSGYVGLSTTNPQDTLDIGSGGYRVSGDGTTGNSVRFVGWTLSSRNATSAASHYIFHNPNGAIGSIQTSGSTTQFNTTSDERLKENFREPQNVLERIRGIHVMTYNYKKDPDKQPIDGFVAQQAKSIVPYAVTVPEKEYNDDGTINPWYMDYSKIVPLVTAAVQKLIDEISGLKSADAQKDREIASLKERLNQSENKARQLEAEQQAIKAWACSKDPSAPFCKSN